uniref:Uncharacterized protein n=1 Tax=Chaetoceros debilis TaxID=122233 RepID=A0A6S8UK74_9STRA
MPPNKAPFFYILVLCSILAVVSIGGMLSSFASTPDSTSNLKQSFENNSVPSDTIISRRLRESIPANFFPKQSKLNEVKLDPEGILKVQKLSDANSTSPLQCSLCGKLGVPLIPDNFLNDISLSCAQLDDYLAINMPIESCRPEIDKEDMCCDQSELLPPYECEQNIRNQILETYDTAVTPASKETRRVDVHTYLVFQYLSKVDVTSSAIEFYLSVYLEWKDPRLAWEVTSDTCVTSMNVRASIDPEKTDIWTPAFDLVNKVRGVQDFSDQPATVLSDGTVRWNRNGIFTALCTFVGLKKMPFDELGCQLHFAVDQQRVKLSLIEVQEFEIGDNGFAKGTFEQSYIEHSIIPERISTGYYIGDRSKNRFHADIFFRRASRHYVMFTIFPNILFVVLSFGQFFLDIGSGERLTFGVTIVLIMVTNGIVVSSLLPLCPEPLWINTINFASMVFTILCLLSTLAGLGIHNSHSNVMIGSCKKSRNEDTVKQSTASYARVEEDSTKDVIDHDKDKLEQSAASYARVEEDSIIDVIDVDNGVIETDDDLNDDNEEKKKPRTLCETDDDLNNDDEEKKKPRTLWKWFTIPKTQHEIAVALDRVFFFSLPILFLLFIIIMFTTEGRYEDEMDSEGHYASWWY